MINENAIKRWENCGWELVARNSTTHVVVMTKDTRFIAFFATTESVSGLVELDVSTQTLSFEGFESAPLALVRPLIF